MSYSGTGALSEVVLPKIFHLGGGTRVFLVRAGPGVKSKLEREAGAEVDIPKAADASMTAITQWTQQRVAHGIEPYLTTLNKFQQPELRVVARPVVFHDGAIKSLASYNIFKENSPMPFVDGMGDTPSHEVDANFFWSRRNTTDPTLLNTFMVFCSMQTIAGVLNKIGMPGRSICGAGAFVPVICPVCAPAALALGMGPNAANFMHWGNITAEEKAAQEALTAGDDEPQTKKLRLPASNCDGM